MKKNWIYLFVMSCVFFLVGCDSSEKILKSDNKDLKKAKVEEWFKKKQYFKAIPVLEELMGVLKGTESTEKYYHMYCWANYYQQDYLLASYHFKNFLTLYPNSDLSEECLFMHAKSSERQSPKWELDQSSTYKALEAYQTFINNYPTSARVDTANIAISKLRKKLEKKALAAAELYYKTQNYKAAAVSFENLMTQYPDIDNVERILYMSEKSYEKYADKSITSKQLERYHKVLDSYRNFNYKFPTSAYQKEALEIKNKAHFKCVKVAFENAHFTRAEDREKQYRIAQRELTTQLPNITNPKQIKKCKNWLAHSQFDLVRMYYFLYEETDKKEQKITRLDQSVKSYYNFVDKYKDSKYAKEAEKYFTNATEALKKLNNGQEQKN